MLTFDTLVKRLGILTINQKQGLDSPKKPIRKDTVSDWGRGFVLAVNNLFQLFKKNF